MKKLILLLIFIPTLVLAQPPGHYMGDFALGVPFLQTMNDYYMSWTCKGISSTGAMIWVITSPENLEIVAGWHWWNKTVRAKYFIGNYQREFSFVIYLVPDLVNNRVQIWVNP